MIIGMIGSAGGGAFASAARILRDVGSPVRWKVVADRACGLESVAAEMGADLRRIEAKENREFSERAAEHLLADGGVDCVLLMYGRLVTKELFGRITCFNIHPALLPAFAGLSPLKRALAGRARFLGATLHLVDETMDAGPIVAQVCSPVDPERDSFERLNKLHYLQKVYLSLVLLEQWGSGNLHIGPDGLPHFQNGGPSAPGASPALVAGPWRTAFNDLQAREGFASSF